MLLYLQLTHALLWSFTSLFPPVHSDPEVLRLHSVNIWSCYPDCKVPPSPQEQTNSISLCQSAALGETKLSTETNRDRQQGKEMQQERDGRRQTVTGRERERDENISSERDSEWEMYTHQTGETGLDADREMGGDCAQNRESGRRREKQRALECNAGRKGGREKWILTGREKKRNWMQTEKPSMKIKYQRSTYSVIKTICTNMHVRN